MRDPWKALALLLALALAALLLLRSRPSPAAPELARPHEAAAPAADAVAVTDERLRRSEIRAEGAEMVGPSATVDLLVRLVDEAGQPVAGSCTARLPDGSTVHPSVGGGMSVLYGLPPVEVRLKALARGYYRREESLLLAPAPDAQQHEMMLERSANIPVTFLTPDGVRLSAALRERFLLADRTSCMPYLFATRNGVLPQFGLTSHDEYSSPHARWDAQNLFGDPSEPDGTLSIWSRPPLTLHVMMRHREIGRVALDALPETLEIVVDPERAAAELASLRLRVLGAATGAPVKEGSIHLIGGRIGLGLAKEGEEGTFERSGLPAGVYVLTGYFGEDGRISRQVVLQPGEDLDLGVLRASLPGSFTIRYHTPEASPIAGVSGILWSTPQAPRLAGMLHSTPSSDPTGLISVEGLIPGGYVFTLAPPADSGWAVAAGRGSVPADEPVELVAQPGALVTFTGGEEEFPRHRLWILVEGFAPARSQNYSTLPLTLRLAPGRHVWVLVDAGGAEVRRGEVEVRDAQEPLRVEVPLP